MNIKKTYKPTSNNLITPSSSVLNNMLSAWRVGKALCRPGTGAHRKPPDWYRDPSVAFTAEEKLLLKQCIFYASKARQMAAQEDIPASCQLFAVARLIGEDSKTRPEVRLFCQSELEAAEAYLDYVCGDTAGARRRLVTAMAADEMLERQYGHADLHMHRIHLANNIVKVEARGGNLSLALSLASCVLRYIDGQLKELPLPGQWGGTYRALMSEAPCRFLARQTTLEVACALADPDHTVECEIWNSFRDTLRLSEPSSARRGDTNDWYGVKHAFLALAYQPSKAATAQYWADAAAFLAQGPRDSVSLWKLVALDAAFACADLDVHIAVQLLDEIVNDLNNAAFLPRHVRSLVSRLSIQHPKPPAFTVRHTIPAFVART